MSRRGTPVDAAWYKLETILGASIQEPLTPEQALEVLDKAEEWIDATREALKDDIKRAAGNDE